MQRVQNFHCCHGSRWGPLFLQDIHTEIFAEGFRDKLFDTEAVAAFIRALRDKDPYVRCSAVELFTAAMAQGGAHCFYRIFILKYLQRAFGTSYLTLRPLPHLSVHYMMKMMTSEAARSNFSLLPWLKVGPIVFTGYSY